MPAFAPAPAPRNPPCLQPPLAPCPPQQSDVVAASLDILAELTARYGSLLPDPEGLKKVGRRGGHG